MPRGVKGSGPGKYVKKADREKAASATKAAKHDRAVPNEVYYPPEAAVALTTVKTRNIPSELFDLCSAGGAAIENGWDEVVGLCHTAAKLLAAELAVGGDDSAAVTLDADADLAASGDDSVDGNVAVASAANGGVIHGAFVPPGTKTTKTTADLFREDPDDDDR